MADIVDIASENQQQHIDSSLHQLRKSRSRIMAIVDEDGRRCCGLCGEPIAAARLKAFAKEGGVGTCINCARKEEGHV